MTDQNLHQLTSLSKKEQIFTFITFLLGFSLPTFPALLNITLGVVLIWVIYNFNLTQFKKTISNPFIYLPALIFLLLLISFPFTQNDVGLTMLGKYKKLLYIAPLVLFFSYQNYSSKVFIKGFELANILILIVSYIIAISDMKFGSDTLSNPTVFKLHITQNFFMSICCIIWLTRSITLQGWKKHLNIALFLLGSYNILFMVLGRTGYLAWLTGVVLVICLSTLTKKQKCIFLLLGFVSISIFGIMDSKPKERLLVGIQEIQQPEKAKEYSMNFRLAAIEKAIALIKESPLIGHGVGGFYVATPENKIAYNPHNEYLNIAVQLGMIGLSLFLYLNYKCYKVLISLNNKSFRNILISVLSIYLICNLFNSFTIDLAEGNLYVVLIALIYIYEKDFC